MLVLPANILVMFANIIVMPDLIGHLLLSNFL